MDVLKASRVVVYFYASIDFRRTMFVDVAIQYCDRTYHFSPLT